ncbi:hypothetical protein CI109_103924 [Kwoniella shandongensis]|uniref:Uncharacterized protein n=1 Tax=Kwoniella shandongensis TaxID=1734106 RepID=A0A5M6BT38_9TREE|nr:uncharacterized protein CI109_005622 [Kwoniella shandongensis]KAA5526026.1 hypothetical protein CI109_005622 [Kwoniella shandongensis]
MAVILRSNADLMYLPDHGFAGEEGALRILPQITRTIRRIDISHNLLGSAGTLTLFKGLTTLRSRYSSPEIGLGIWGLSELNLGVNSLDDAALDGVLAYAKKDGFLQRVFVQGNDIRFLEGLESIVNSLNSSRIRSLSLTNNTSLDPGGVGKFLHKLDSTHLSQLHLSACELPNSVTGGICEYLRSDRSRNLEVLELNGNKLGAKGVERIVDVIESSNFSLRVVGLLANTSLEPAIVSLDDGNVDVSEHQAAVDMDVELRSLEYQVHTRLPSLLERNRILTRRVRTAASKIITPARIILNARIPSDQETAQRVINEISSTSSPPTSFFPLLDLPEEVIHLIVRNVGGDDGALSEAQWTRLRVEAGDREALARNMRMREERMRGKRREEERDVIRGLRDDWLKRGRWDRWEERSR